MAEPTTILECIHDFISTCTNETIYNCLLPVLQQQSRSFKDMSIQACEFAIFKYFYKSLISSDRTYLFLHLLCPFSDNYKGQSLSQSFCPTAVLLIVLSNCHGE